MMKYTKSSTLLAVICSVVSMYLFSCTGESEQVHTQADEQLTMKERVDQYTTVILDADLSKLSDNQKKIIGLLIDAGKAMDEVFWEEAYGHRDSLMNALDNQVTKEFVDINYGPWNRLEDNRPFIEGVGPKPKGANFYPKNMTKEEFEEWDSEAKDNLYTLVRRDEKGNLMTIPYHKAFSEQHKLAAQKLKEAAKLAENPGFRKYLNLRAEALLTDNYQASDIAWLDMKNNALDVVIGPIETYEDKLFGYKAAHETFVLIKDKEWSDRLAKYAEVLPELQKGLPVPEEYKQETPGRESDLGAYNAVYYAGSANAGGKTIAINLPNDEEVQLQKGTRRLQLKNAIRAKYEKILVPIANELIVEEQQGNISFDAFFSNTMFHEVAHGLGIKNTITGKGTVRQALKEHASALEEGKADVLGLYMIQSLRNKGMITDGSLEDNFVTFVASIFRSIRFGTGDAHGLANLIRFNFFKKMEAITYNEEAEAYRVNIDKMKAAIDALSRKILIFQGDGDYEGVDAFVQKYGQVGPRLQANLDRLAEEDIPRDIIFKQGKNVLGIK